MTEDKKVSPKLKKILALLNKGQVGQAPKLARQENSDGLWPPGLQFRLVRNQLGELLSLSHTEGQTHSSAVWLGPLMRDVLLVTRMRI